ncbi:stage III sporulation protein SpoIIIAB [Mangrovibacillus cuniculi]|uniref:Stage III sporulation protein SpoAB n=1 Tax=Mangrovibacillus cuniculi TaxID=2593652 RepID=A0A7S8CBC5_9BACI|nr:stage III sporulation protein SpoIIIAB [Mangrovibacillus cuniculi]QPC46833.1 stage III sporulation protein SpoAB [Mangrovibacillus cuniculi]
MLKLVGAILILLSTTWAGFEFSRSLSERPRQLRWVKNALQTLEAEIMFGHTHLDVAAKRISTQVPKPIGWIFHCFSENLQSGDTTVKEAWKSGLDEAWKLTALKQREYEVLLQFGENLGKHDRYTQQNQIMLTLTHLEQEEEEARDQQQKYEKMVKSLGVLSGLLLVVLLM